MNNSGIYLIVNTINSKRYIGSAHNFSKRWVLHKSRLRLNKHANTHLQNAYNKYGKDVFKYEILFKCPKEYCIKLEQWCIDNLKPEYNICKVAGNRAGHKQSAETIRKRMESFKKCPRTKEWNERISKSQTGKIISKESIEKMMRTLSKNTEFQKRWEEARERSKKKVYQYDLEGNFIKEWSSQHEIAIFLNCRVSTVANACKGKLISCKGWYVSYTKVDTFKPRIKKEKLSKHIYQYSLNGDLIKIWNNVFDINKELGFSKKQIYKCCRQELTSYKNFKWSDHKI